jgi:hypothetical protein
MTKTRKSAVSKSGGASVAGGLVDTVIEMGQERARVDGTSEQAIGDSAQESDESKT